MTASRAALRRRLESARLMILVGTPDAPDAVLATSKRCLEAGGRLLQLRFKQADASDRLAVARALRARTRAHNALLIVNDDPELAVACEADGVHGGQDDLSTTELRRIVGPDRLVGLTVHNVKEARRARTVARDLDYVGLGTIFPSPTKPALPAAGTALIAAARPELPGVAIFAIGGITAENAVQCIDAGATGVAVAAAVTRACDPGATTRALVSLLDLETDEGRTSGGRPPLV